jgi:hypothetical protein
MGSVSRFWWSPPTPSPDTFPASVWQWETARTKCHRMCTTSAADGPYGGVVMDQAGNLYGVGGSAFELSLGTNGWKETPFFRVGFNLKTVESLGLPSGSS